jgi:hypothetical protein
MVAGAKLAATDSPLFDALPASDAPVANFPGHRREKILTPNHAFVAASAPATAVSLSVGYFWRAALFRRRDLLTDAPAKKGV